MIKIALSKIEWTQNIGAGGEFNKSCAPKPGVLYWYIGQGVLVEHEGKPGRFIPIGNVLAMEAGDASAEEWCGMPAPAKNAPIVVPMGARAAAPSLPPAVPLQGAVAAPAKKPAKK